MGLSYIHRASLIGTWAGQNLDAIYTSHKGLVPCRLQDERHEVTLREGSLVEERETTAIVQEDQAGEPWSLYVGLYTIDEGFKAPPERN